MKRETALWTVFFSAMLVSNIAAEKISSDTVTESLQNLEGRIGMTEGKALLTSGRTCILNEEALKDEELAIHLLHACLREYEEQSANSQEQ